MAETRFAALGQTPSTLLVQAVDHHIAQVAALIAPFRFIPNWRIDDVMVSYATDDGGVGPHFDQYDVFLIQGHGQRRWRVGQHCDSASPLLPHDDLRLLAQFNATNEWLLEPGDILYVPPGIAHDGVAVGDDCMTYSIGFRAPSRSELMADFADYLVADMEDDDRYADPGLLTQSNPGEISATALDALHAMITEKLADRDAFVRWFGGYNSMQKYPQIDWSPEEPATIEDVRDQLANGATLVRNPASRFSFVRDNSELLLFVDGECVECSDETAAFAAHLCAEEGVDIAPELARSEAVRSLIVRLVNQGSVAFEDGD
jgi:50S ribosomal protein L16 3-hydroxylase